MNKSNLNSGKGAEANNGMGHATAMGDLDFLSLRAFKKKMALLLK